MPALGEGGRGVGTAGPGRNRPGRALESVEKSHSNSRTTEPRRPVDAITDPIIIFFANNSLPSEFGSRSGRGIDRFEPAGRVSIPEAADAAPVSPGDIALLASLLLLLQSAAVPGGQGSPPQSNAPASCQAFEAGPDEQGRGPRDGAILYVGCGSSAVRIGRVESYRSSYHPGTASLAVVVQERGRTRILVAQQETDGTLQMQDMSRDLAKATGRPFDVGLRGVEVDLGRFAAEGSISAPSLGRPGTEGRLTPGHYVLPGRTGAQAQSETPPGASPE